MCSLTFDHDHVDVDGANGRLGQPLPFLQDVGDFPGGDAVVRLASECHQLPDGHSWREKEAWRDEKKAKIKTERDQTAQFISSSHLMEAHFIPTSLLGQIFLNNCVNQASDGNDTHHNSTRRSDG